MSFNQPRATVTGADALSLLKAGHDGVRQLFEEFGALSNDEEADDDKQALADRICALLTVHTTIEEEIFYPAAREALGNDELLDDAEVEHASAKDLIGQIEAGSPGQDLYDAQVRVLGEYINHHVIEEEQQLFPKLTAAGIDLDQLGDEMAQRRDDLMSALE